MVVAHERGACAGSSPVLGLQPQNVAKFNRAKPKGETQMAKEKLITRTIRTTKATVLFTNVKEKTTFEQDVTVADVYDDTDKLLKVVANVANTEDTRAVAILSSEVVETLYGMEENAFIKGAKILPRRAVTETVDK